MNLTLSVKRSRPSATQGFATVSLNGEDVITFGDDIQLVEDGKPFYGENIGGWASTKPDMDFFRAVLFPEDVTVRKAIGLALDKIAAKLELAEAEEQQNAMIRSAGGGLGLREADDAWNDTTRRQIASLLKLCGGTCYLGKINEEQEHGGIITRYDGKDVVRNFGADFAVPTNDRKLCDLIRDWRGGKLHTPGKIMDRVKELGGVWLHWV